MKKIILGNVMIGLIALSACNSNTTSQNQQEETATSYIDTTHTSQNSLDWQGIYEGTLPCADCPGIKTTITLENKGSFVYQAEYLDRNLVVADSGAFMWHDNGSVVHLKGEDVDIKFQVGENQLFHLDENGDRISGELAEYYILKKVE